MTEKSKISQKDSAGSENKKPPTIECRCKESKKMSLTDILKTALKDLKFAKKK